MWRFVFLPNSSEVVGNAIEFINYLYMNVSSENEGHLIEIR